MSQGSPKNINPKIKELSKNIIQPSLKLAKGKKCAIGNKWISEKVIAEKAWLFNKIVNI